MSNSNFSSAAQLRVLLSAQEDVFAAELALRKAEDHHGAACRLCLSGDLHTSEVDTAAIEAQQKLNDLRYAVGILWMAKKAWREAVKAEVDEADEARSFLANSGQVEVLPFVVNAWQG